MYMYIIHILPSTQGRAGTRLQFITGELNMFFLEKAVIIIKAPR
jgi:hypothetical protein